MMSEFVRLLARNTAILLLLPNYTKEKHYYTANNMVTVLLEAPELTTEILKVLYKNALKLEGRTTDDKRTIRIIREDLRYLLRMKGEK